MDRNTFYLWIIILNSCITNVLGQYNNPNQNGRSESKPNIVFILMDDVGWKDLGSYGSKFYETPNLDDLARKGIRFTNSYAYPQCSPSRYALMTGQNPARVGLTRAIVPSDHRRGGPGERIFHHRPDWYLADPVILDHMPKETQTLPELLRDAGYTTAMFGKWHLGTMQDDPPTRHGFDVYFGGAESGPRSYFSPYKLEFLEDGPEGEHVDDRLTAEAIGFMKEQKQPFFLFMSYYDVHGPWQAKPELIDKFSNKMDFEDRQMNPVYAAMLATLDKNIGRLTGFLEKKGLMENTILIISSDNGGLEFRNGFGRDNLGAFPIGTTITSNEPLRGGKSTIYEGGLRVPTIVLLPEGKSGIVDNTPISIWDWMPTLLEATGTVKKGIQHMDGVSLLPLMLNAEKPDRKSLFWHFPHYQIGPSRNPEQTNFINRPCTVIRQGDWKLIYNYGASPELYNLADDFRESKNLTSQKPQVVQELSGEILDWLCSIQAYRPLRNVNYKPQVQSFR